MRVRGRTKRGATHPFMNQPERVGHPKHLTELRVRHPPPAHVSGIHEWEDCFAEELRLLRRVRPEAEKNFRG